MRAIPHWNTSTPTPSRFRFSVKDATGVLRELASYANLASETSPDPLIGATWGEDVDGHGLNATIRLARQVGDAISLSPLADASPLNKAWSASTPNQLLAVGRFVKLEAALAPEGAPASVLAWKSVFEGWIDVIDWDSDPIILECRGLHAPLMDNFFEVERVYNYSTDVDYDGGARIFKPLDSFAVGNLVLPTDGKRNGHFYEATAITTGLAGSAEPTWPTTPGGTVVSAGVTFTEKGATSITAFKSIETTIQTMLNDVMGAGAYTLITPTSPTWNLKPWKQQRVSVWDAIKHLADQIGWFLRFTVREATGPNFGLYLTAPDRAAAATPVAIDVTGCEVRKARVDLTGIRNVIRVWYSDANTLDSSGNPIRTFVERTDSASVTKYGRRFMEVAESSSSNIDTSTEATAFADAILADLKEPSVDLLIALPLTWWLQLGDLVTLSDYSKEQTILGSSSFTLGINEIDHEVSEGEGTTTIGIRGKPSAGFGRWLKTDVARRSEDLQLREFHQGSLFGRDTAIELEASSVVGGQQLQIKGNPSKHGPLGELEFHVSESASFSPTAATLVGAGAGNSLVLSDLNPGRTYYTKVVPYARNAGRLIRGEPTEEVTFIAGRGIAGHLNAEVAWGRNPLNGGFESRFNPTDAPDHWIVDVGGGTWGTDWQILTGSGNQTEGDASLRMVAGATQRSVSSAYFDVNGLEKYRLSYAVRVNASTAGHEIYVVVRWFLYDKSYDSQGGDLYVLPGGATGWAVREVLLTPPTSARYGRVSIFKGAPTETTGADFDAITVESIGAQWRSVGAGGEPAFTNSWVNYSGGYFPAQFRKDRMGRLELRGLIKSGTIGVSAFTLPVGYRPAMDIDLPSDGGGGFGRVVIQTSGNVVPAAGSNAWYSLWTPPLDLY